MPTEFQKAVDYTPIGLKNTYCFLDDILIVSKGSEVDHKQYVLKCLKRLDDKNLRINLPKCLFSKLQIDWLGYHNSQSGILPIESKTSFILSLEARRHLKNSVLFWVQSNKSLNLYPAKLKLANHSDYPENHLKLSGLRNMKIFSLK